MRKLFLIIMMILGTAGIAYGQSAKEAVEALKKLESRVQVGISYNDYGPALGETHYKVKMFLESPNSNNNPALKKPIGKALEHYIYAKDIWGYKIEHRSDIIYRDLERNPRATSHDVKYVGPQKDSLRHMDRMLDDLNKSVAVSEKRMADGIVNKYPGVLKTMNCSYIVDLSSVLPVIWQEASNEIQSATKLLYSEQRKPEEAESVIKAKPYTGKSTKQKQSQNKSSLSGQRNTSYDSDKDIIEIE